MILKYHCHVSRLSKYHLEIFSRVYEHDVCGPCAVPSVCRNFLLLKVELLHDKQSSKPKIYLTRGY